jgi:3-oxoacyl-[acyl-carrier-protein] synthase-3
MIFKDVYIAGLACELPPNVVTSAELEERLKPLYERLKLPHGRLELMTGIKERRFWDQGMTPSKISTLAGEKAIAAGGIPKEKITAVIHASVCRDFLEPATANLVHHRLGLPDSATVYDLSNACLGVLNGMVMVANMIDAGQIEAGLVVSGEMGEPLVNGTIDFLNNNTSLTRQSVKPAFASMTIGSAGAAVLLAKKDIAGTSHRLVGGVTRSATNFSELCRSSTTDTGISSNTTLLMDTDSEELLHAGCALAAETFPLFKKEVGWNDSDINRAFTHQVGVAHRKLMYEKIGLDPALDFPTVEFLGNTGSAALPSALAIGAEEGALTEGDKAALLGIGSGLNSIMLGVEW